MELYKSTSVKGFENLTLYNENVMRQVHHSMMNGLQSLQSLLSIKAMESRGATVDDYLKKSQSLISVLAAAHQVVVRNKFFFTTDCNEYLQILVSELRRIHECEKRIAVHLSVKNVILNTENALTIGFIINELVSNSFQHAFLYGINGIITIELYKNKQDRFELKYTDDGKGYDEDTTAKKLGMELVHLFAGKINGTVCKEPGSDGTVYKITFNENKY